MHNRCVKLMEESEYVIVQNNNLRTYYRPNSCRVPQQGSEVYIGNLPRDMFEDELVPIFKAQGTICNMRLVISHDGFNCGFCFVQYYVPHHAQRALLNINGLEIKPGHRVTAKNAIEARRVYIGGLPRNKTFVEVWAMLEKYVTGIQNVVMFPDKHVPYYNRGFAFVNFTTRRDATEAMKKLCRGELYMWGRNITINWAIPQIDTNPAVMTRVKVLFIRNLGFNITVADLERFLERFAGSIAKIRQIDDYAFVHFNTRHAAELCFEAIAGKVLGGSIIEVTWARPRFYKNLCELVRAARANRFL